MAGHSKFKNIMYRKGAQDAKRSKIFSKLAREITVAAKSGMPDPNLNPRLRAVVLAARQESMPKDNIERAIRKAAEPGGDDYEELRYEGFGPGGVALIVEALTDNRNRTATHVRTIFAKNGGNLGATGSVSHGFEHVGLIGYATGTVSADAVFEAALEAGADDVVSTDDGHEVYTAMDSLHEVAKSLEAGLGSPTSLKLVWRAKEQVVVDEAVARTLLGLIDSLDDDDDVQTVYGNYDVPDDVMAKLG